MTVTLPPSRPAAVRLPVLPRPTPQRLGRLTTQIARRPDLWRRHLRHHAHGRAYVRIGRTPTYEAWLLTWTLGSTTDVHDHGGSAGAFVVVHGSLQERTVSVDPDGLAWSYERRLVPGRVRAFGPQHVHEVLGAEDRTVSLHVYAPALTAMRRYEVVDDRLRLVEQTRAGADW